MGQIVSDVEKIIGVSGSLDAVKSIGGSVSDAKKEKKKLKSDILEVETERQKLIRQMAEANKNKANLIKKTIAKQRAGYGAGGASADSDSDVAVLKRLEKEINEDFLEREISQKESMDELENQKKNLVRKYKKTKGSKNLLKSIGKNIVKG